VGRSRRPDDDWWGRAASRWHCWVAGGWFAVLAPPPAVAPLPCVLRHLTAARTVKLRVDLAHSSANDCFFVCVAQALFGDDALGRRGALAAAVAALRTMQRGEQQRMAPAAERLMRRQLGAAERHGGGWAVPPVRNASGGERLGVATDAIEAWATAGALGRPIVVLRGGGQPSLEFQAGLADSPKK
jgi:hypothetical protein